MTKLKMERIGIQKKQGSVVEILKNEILLGNIPSGTEMTQNELVPLWVLLVEFFSLLKKARIPVKESSKLCRSAAYVLIASR